MPITIPTTAKSSVNFTRRRSPARSTRAIESLSPKCREVFRMSHIEGLSNREISEQLGITLSTVENHIYNALKQLRQKLSHYKMLIFLTMYILGK